MGIEDIPEPERSRMLEEDFARLERLAAEAEEQHYEDPGDGNYDSGHEDEVRGLMELTAFYDESGPRHDPEGKYLCGSCCLRAEEDECLFVEGKISFTEGSCDIYVIGEPLSARLNLLGKYAQEGVGYAERPEALGFGCNRCSYSAEARASDIDGRPLWCEEWGVHVQPTACCGRHKGPDMVLAPGEEAA